MILVRNALAVAAQAVKPSMACDGTVTVRLAKRTPGTRVDLVITNVYVPGQTDP